MNPNLVKSLVTTCILYLAFSLPATAGKPVSHVNFLKVPDNISFLFLQNTSTDNSVQHEYANIKLAPPLPLTLIQFTISKTTSDKVELGWKTAQEVNVSHFNIERSSDGRKWVKIGVRQAKGQQGSVETYSFTDPNPVDDANYYRLHVVDYDQRSDYSPVRLITFGNESTIRVYPTLTKSNSTLFVEGISPELAQVEIFNNDGNIVQKFRMYSNTFTLPSMLNGIYHIRITNTVTNTTVCQQKIVIH